MLYPAGSSWPYVGWSWPYTPRAAVEHVVDVACGGRRPLDGERAIADLDLAAAAAAAAALHRGPVVRSGKPAVAARSRAQTAEDLVRDHRRCRGRVADLAARGVDARANVPVPACQQQAEREDDA